MTDSIDILILSNGPGEITTWVRPVVRSLRQRFGEDRDRLRISVILSPCANASGREVAIARSYPAVDRVQGAKDFFPFLLWGKTAENWDWRDRGVVIFLGGDQIFPVIIGKRLGYKTLIYGEWETRWHGWVDRFGVMKPELINQAPSRYAHKFTVVGDLMADVGSTPDNPLTSNQNSPIMGLLPGSKAAKLAQGVPLCLAIAQYLHKQRPDLRFILPVAPTLDLNTLERFADPQRNPVSAYFGGIQGQIIDSHYLQTTDGMTIELYTDFPAYDILAQCQLCLTTIGANTAELGALGVPMIVLLPTQQLDAMRAWDGIPGLLANLPGVGTAIAKLINAQFLKKSRLLAWPNIWARKEIVPELVGHLEPEAIAQQVLNYLDHPEQLEQMRANLRHVRGTSGAANRLTTLVETLLGEG
ncbi:MAG: lipid-A-disaccharide synthase [Synechococcales cyanobacterium T60_A2020_003]|nr:lipid-A-disaccharide synthase [Synechococcales cyanobacterium T60_A2020_003]